MGIKQSTSSCCSHSQETESDRSRKVSISKVTPEKAADIFSKDEYLMETHNISSCDLLVKPSETMVFNTLQRDFKQECHIETKTEHVSRPRYHDVYETRKCLTETIFGDILIATHRKTNRIRAVKKFKKNLMRRGVTKNGHSVAENFDMELKLMNLLREYPHPGLIATAPETEQVEDLQFKYIVMPLVSGGDLFKFIENNRGQICGKLVCDIFLQLISALQHLHEQTGCIHGDISPENILVSYDDTASQLRVQLCDYGLACKIGSRHHCYGKLSYKAPEHFDDQSHIAEPASDVFSLAVVMFILYYGRPPFQTAEHSDVHYKYLHKTIQYRSSYCSKWLRKWGVSKERCHWSLLGTILSMFNRDPKQRPTLNSVKKIIECSTS